MASGLMVGVTAVCVAFSLSSLAQEALVEEAPPGSGVVPYQFLEIGHQINLDQGARVVLGYPASCVHESILGGRVVIGAGQSNVQGGSVERQTLDCADNVELSKAEREGNTGSGHANHQTRSHQTRPR